MYLRSSNSLHSILVTVFCKKQMKQNGMVQPITHNLVRRKQDGSEYTTWYTSATSVGPHGIVQPIAVAMM